MPRKCTIFVSPNGIGPFVLSVFAIILILSQRGLRLTFRIISTAVPWNLHESRQGEFDFSGRTDPAKDLVVFLELSREFGFKIILKPGPWIRAQWRNGGIPDFVFRHPETAAKD